MNERTYWRTLSSRILFASQWYNLLQDAVGLPNGAEITYTWVEHPGCAVIVPLTAQREVVMLRQYRYILNEFHLELPAGGREPADPDMLTCAQRELAEEIGLSAAHWTELGRYYAANGMSNIQPYCYLAEGLSHVANKLDHTEQAAGLELVTFPFAEAVEMCYDGRIVDGLSIVALLFAARRMQNIE